MIKSLEIGTLTVRTQDEAFSPLKPIEHTQQSEFAAWYTASVANKGQTKPLFIATKPYSGPYVKTHVYATLDAIITSNNNAPHFGGVPFGPGTNDAGKPTDFQFSVSLLQAVACHMFPVTKTMALFDRLPYTIEIRADMFEHVREIALNEGFAQMEWCRKALEQSYAELDYNMVEFYAREIHALGDLINRVAYRTGLAHEAVKMPRYAFTQPKPWQEYFA